MSTPTPADVRPDAVTYETRPVAYAATPRKHRQAGAYLTHTVRVIGDEWEPLCGRVKADSLVYGDGGTDARPTCPHCLRRDPRFKEPAHAR